MENSVLLDAGSGGKASQRLINNFFLKYFDNKYLRTLDDGALLPIQTDKIVMSTDGYTVSPLFFAGGSIGTLAIDGTVNDISMLGAKPLWLSCSFIIEEGLPLELLESIVKDMANECVNADIQIVTGDTKVVPKGCCDKIFITTSGIGEVYIDHPPSGHYAKKGDSIIINGPVGDHGLAIMAARDDVSFLSGVRSDCTSLTSMVQSIVNIIPEVHVLRDPTRGGLATTLNEIAEQSGAGIEIDETRIPVNDLVVDGCSFLGLDPLYLANEGKCICIVPEEDAKKVLKIMKAFPYGEKAAVIGKVTEKNQGKVVLKTRIGGSRFLGMLEGAQLPRIC